MKEQASLSENSTKSDLTCELLRKVGQKSRKLTMA